MKEKPCLEPTLNFKIRNKTNNKRIINKLTVLTIFSFSSLNVTDKQHPGFNFSSVKSLNRHPVHPLVKSHKPHEVPFKEMEHNLKYENILLTQFSLSCMQYSLQNLFEINNEIKVL